MKYRVTIRLVVESSLNIYDLHNSMDHAIEVGLDDEINKKAIADYDYSKKVVTVRKMRSPNKRS